MSGLSVEEIKRDVNRFLHRIEEEGTFVIVKEGQNMDDVMQEELKKHVVKKIGAIAKPEKIIFTVELPKTRSGKIMRRLLRDIAEGRALGDVTTLADSAVVESLKHKYDEA